MPWEEAEPYIPTIKAHLAKLARRFPTDVTEQSLRADIVENRKTLWLIFDGDKLLATAMTKLEVIDATGIKILRMMDLGGENIAAWAEALEEAMTAYGNEHGVDYRAVEGRSGWGRVIEKFGYKPHATLWRKRA